MKNVTLKLLNRMVFYCALSTLVAFMVSGCTVKPSLFNTANLVDSAGKDIEGVIAEQEPVTAPIALSEAIARAIKYNRDRRVKMMEEALAEHQLEVVQFDMLPKLTANAGYAGRDPVLASSSESVETGLESLEPSTSQERNRGLADLNLTWNVLDFGLSYVRAKQEADHYLIAQEKKRKALHNIIQDVQRAYWRAISAEYLLARTSELMGRVSKSLVDAEKVASERIRNPLEAYSYQRELLEIIRKIREIELDLIGAKAELAILMGMPPDTPFELAADEAQPDEILSIDLAINDMERTALVSRPELMEARYRSRITSNEVHASLLKLLPGIDLTGGIYYDSNSYLVSNDWAEFGARISWNLFHVFKYPAIQKLNLARGGVIEEQRIALSMAVISQVHLSNLYHNQAVKDLELARRYVTVEGHILDHVKAESKAERIGQLRLVREELNMLLARMRQDIAYATMQESFVRVFISMGLDPVPQDVDGASLDDLIQAISKQLTRWKEGKVAIVSEEL